MRIKFNHPHLSIKNLDSVDLPDFTLLIGRNGVGKTQLLDAIKRNSIAVAGFSPPEIEMYNLNSFTPQNSKQVDWGHSSFAERTAGQFFFTKVRFSSCESCRKYF